jgi:hypothetical protein
LVFFLHLKCAPKLLLVGSYLNCNCSFLMQIFGWRVLLDRFDGK